jgi:hypothetical protein
MTDANEVNDQELLSRAIAGSGKSVRRFAREELVREPRTVWRWLAGENPVPAMVREHLQAYVVEHPAPEGWTPDRTPKEDAEE